MAPSTPRLDITAKSAHDALAQLGKAVLEGVQTVVVTPTDDAIAKAIAAWEPPPTVRHLTLRTKMRFILDDGGRIGRDGARALAGLVRWPALETLEIDGNGIDADALLELIAAVPQTRPGRQRSLPFPRPPAYTPGMDRARYRALSEQWFNSFVDGTSALLEAYGRTAEAAVIRNLTSPGIKTRISPIRNVLKPLAKLSKGSPSDSLVTLAAAFHEIAGSLAHVDVEWMAGGWCNLAALARGTAKLRVAGFTDTTAADLELLTKYDLDLASL